MKLSFTVDWEDWYHGLGIPVKLWKSLEKRIKIGHYKLLDLLSKNRIKATFFLLGIQMEEFPELVWEIKSEGHELACHTYSHPFLSNLSPHEFREELRKCCELIKPYQKSFRGFRAPYFSVNSENLWTLDILKQLNFLYDSSIFPGQTFRSGIPTFPKKIATISNGLIEYPISKFQILSFDFGVGGAYFRILPYSYFRKRLQNLLKTQNCLFYFHPWELDSEQPYVAGLKHRAVHTHYFNLSTTYKKLSHLFTDFDFVPLLETLKTYDSDARRV
jgi:polysaccharide deacetylase family protein (PEP-CTERM system associated)